MIDVNLRGVAYGVQVVYPRMVRQGSGHIVSTASVAGLVGAVGEGSYTATKHAVVGLSKSLRTEGRRHGVRVSVLCPGAIRTPIFTGGKYGRMNYVGLREEKMLELWSRMRPMEPDAFAQKALDAVARNEAIIVVPRWWRAFWYLDRISPAMSDRLWGAMLTYLRKEITASGARRARTGARRRPSLPRRGPRDLHGPAQHRPRQRHSHWSRVMDGEHAPATIGDAVICRRSPSGSEPRSRRAKGRGRRWRPRRDRR